MCHLNFMEDLATIKDNLQISHNSNSLASVHGPHSSTTLFFMFNFVSLSAYSFGPAPMPTDLSR